MTSSAKPVKCLVWDLDNTVWRGVLLEDAEVAVRPEAVTVLRELDRRGILHSVASRNDPDTAMAKLAEVGLAEFFLAPRIGWSSKSSSVKAIAEDLNLGLDAFGFVDDDRFEAEEVAFEVPGIRCYDSADLLALLDAPELTPERITTESAQRRLLYQADVRRRQEEERFEGPREAFLAQLDMEFTIAHAGEEDLERAEELTVRTHQLNTTGRTYDLEELRALASSEEHLLLVARLRDRYGDYGTIGLALVERGAAVWTLKLLLMSCRVMSRGVGSIMLGHLMALARDEGVAFHAELVPTDRNRVMLVTLRFAGFREVAGDAGGTVVLEADLDRVPVAPPYVDVRT